MDQIEELIDEQLQCKADLMKFKDSFATCVPERLSKLGYLRSRLELCDAYLNTFQGNHVKIHKLLKVAQRSQTDFAYFSAEEHHKFEEIFADLKGDILDKIALLGVQDIQNPNINNQATDNIANQTLLDHTFREEHDIHLPTIKLPEFDGSYKKWFTFHDLYVGMIHNKHSLPNAQKLYYLKKCLSGEAFQLIQSIPCTNANYDTAWKNLCARYDNKRFLVESYLKSLCEQPEMVKESASCIRKLLDTTKECLTSINNLKVKTETWDIFVIFLVSQKLDNSTRKHWEVYLSAKNSDSDSKNSELPRLDDFYNFLEDSFRSLEALDNRIHLFSKDRNTTQNKSSFRTRSLHTTKSTKKYPSCPCCDQEHYLYSCGQFKSLTHDKKIEIAKNKHLCLNCLTPGHVVPQCRSKSNCQKCIKRHHTLLHIENNTTSSNSEHYTDLPSTSQAYSLSCAGAAPQILLATARVKVSSSTGDHVLRALVDQGSQTSFITESCVQRLKLRKYPANCTVSGIGSTNTRLRKGVVEFHLKSCVNTSFQTQVRAFVMSSISSYVVKYNVSSLPHQFKNITLADPFYAKHTNIDILLGADIFYEIILDGIIKTNNGPLAQRTQLGWILSGPINSNNGDVTHNATTLVSNVTIDNSLRKFWELEEVSLTRSPSSEDAVCDAYFHKTHLRSATGRYIVRLPFRSNVSGHEYPVFQNTIHAAKRRFLHLEERIFPKNPTLKIEYTKFINEYIQLNHMKLKGNLEDLQPSENVFILPHHGVWKESSSTTKLRVVFDGSSKPLNSTSLNHELLPGPTLQNDLSSVILKWRIFLIVFTSDIEKMFRQIVVHPDETKFQMILWRSNPSSPLQMYELQTVTYGTTCAPYLSIRVLKQLASDELHKYPLGSKILDRDIYVDDVISGADDIATAKQIQTELKELLHSGGFNLRKWTSNCPDLLAGLKPEDCEFSFNTEHNSDNTAVKALSLYWNPQFDYFYFKISIPSCNSFTKRNLLSDASKLFDPLGWLAPTIILAKIYFQQLWIEGVGWDDPLPHKLKNDWESFRSNLPSLQSIRIPRWLGTTSTCYGEIHGFSDASNCAYSAVLYCRTVLSSGSISVNIITAKTKVAPIKQVSLPRLELCGALLLAKLYKKFTVATNAECNNINSFFWTDSTIVLSWIRSLPIRWKTFVANRVSEIQEITNTNQWFHVPSDHNPADCASRGVQPQDLEKHHLWWKGPLWLSRPKTEWPNLVADHVHTDLEEKTVVACTSTSLQSEFNYLCRFSSLNRLLRVTAYILRFKKALPKYQRCCSGFLKADELQIALSKMISLSQALSFSVEINNLRNKKEISSKSKILNLHPFLDAEGQLRVGGRLRFSNIDEESKHPLILSKSCQLSKLLVADAHIKTLHGGTQLMMTYLRLKYWIINLRNLAKAQFHSCVLCTRFNKKRTTQLMGSLPKVRVTESRAFRHSGVDYAGPFDLKVSKGRSPKTFKGFICIFICLVTKAIHIELVSDISSEGFIAAFRRFTARRGSCSHLYSDNGTNFVGANKELKKMNRQFLEQVTTDIHTQLENEGTSWSFIPPASPHFGGLWEAGVKSVKYHLKRILLNRILSFEEMYTLLVQIESSLNSRPLCPLSDDPTDLSVLTPAHFLIGEPTITIPEPSLLNLQSNRLAKWQQIQQMHQHFWDRWRKEFLSRLQQRPKWTKAQRNFEINDIVIIADERYPPSKWPLARVVKVHPGADDICRVVSLYSNGKTFKRPITKLRLLPSNNPISPTNTD